MSFLNGITKAMGMNVGANSSANVGANSSGLAPAAPLNKPVAPLNKSVVPLNKPIVPVAPLNKAVNRPAAVKPAAAVTSTMNSLAPTQAGGKRTKRTKRTMRSRRYL